MVFVTLFFLLGNCSLHLLPKLPPVHLVVLVTAFLMALTKVLSIQKYKIHWLIAYALGFLWVLLQAQGVINKRLPEAIEGKRIMVIGTIASIPERKHDHYRFEVDVEGLPEASWQNPGRIRLLYKLNTEKTILQVGDTWQFEVKLKRPHAYANPGSFDSERHLFQNKINAEGYVIPSGMNRRIASKFWCHPIARIRSHIRNLIAKNLENKAFSGLIQALVVGVRDDITFAQWQVFQKTGTAHLMAISGLHVGLVAGFAFLLVNLLWRPFLNLYPQFPLPWVSALFTITCACLYGLLAGFSIPTKRALVMVSVGMLGIINRRKISRINIYCLALFIVLVLDPLSTLSPGFYLSFMAVGIIFYGMQGRVEVRGLWWRFGRIQWITFIGLMPITLVFFQKISWISPFCNAIAIPWVSFLVVPLALLGSGLSLCNEILGKIVLSVSEGLFAILWPFLEAAAAMPSIVWLKANYNVITISLSFLGVLLIMAPRGFPARYLGFIALLPLVFLRAKSIDKQSFRVTVLDVGQGLSTVVETENHLLVYDTGPKLNAQFDTGDRIVLPFLANLGKQKIDILMISHGDNDHVGGADSILNTLPVKTIISSEIDLFPQKKVIPCYASQKWTWDGVVFEVLHPDSLITKKRNDHSCVLLISAGKESVLLTGDIEIKSEKKILSHFREKLSAKVMLVPHHGSRSSSSLEFIQAINPDYAIIPAGYRNRYGHPKPDIVKRYQTEGIRVLNTIEGGAISFIMGPNGFVRLPSLYRETHPHYWNE